jgi:AraC family transcriptional regulator, transcriptional activator of pobA
MKKIPVRKINSSLKEPSLRELFNIRDLKKLLQGRDMVQDLHRHDFFFILALRKGKGTHEIDFKPYKVGDNTVFFIRPGQVHQITLKAGSTGYLIGFSKDFYAPDDRCTSQLLRKIGTMTHCTLSHSAFQKTESTLASTLQEYNVKPEGYDEVIKANLCIFFTELVRQRQNTNKLPTPDKSYAIERFDSFMSLLDTHISTCKQVSEYASMLNLSSYQLNAITRLMTGKTSSAMINEQIILEAKRNLLATSAQVKEIAYRLGYEDVSYFIRFFKKHTGFSPELFRQNFK